MLPQSAQLGASAWVWKLTFVAPRVRVTVPAPVPAPPPPPAQTGAQEKAEASADNAARSAAKAAAAPAAEAKLGTGHGERIAARTTTTEFRRQSAQPNEVITIYYDSRANLIARGIIPGAPRYGHPNPFPGGFAPDPKG